MGLSWPAGSTFSTLEATEATIVSQFFTYSKIWFSFVSMTYSEQSELFEYTTLVCTDVSLGLWCNALQVTPS